MNKNLMPIENIVEAAKKMGVDFGKGNPYNRLRYYTKIGWLPHMVRQKDPTGKITGHYPTWVLDNIVKIENMKKQSVPNYKISQLIKSKTKWQEIKELFSNKEQRSSLANKLYIMIITLFILLELIFAYHRKISFTQRTIHPTTDNYTPYIFLQDAGSATIESGKNQIKINSPYISNDVSINITFEENYLPVTRYWVEKDILNKYFTLNTDLPLQNNAKFHWAIIKN